jgi:hypothetical protein
VISLLQLEATFATLDHLGIRVLLKKDRNGMLAHEEDVGFHIAKGTVVSISEES